MRYSFNDVFVVQNGAISPRRPVQIGGVTMTPGVSFGGGASFSGINLLDYLGKDLEGSEVNGILVIKGFYD